MPVVLQSSRWLGVLFGGTIFLSAFLLFGVQPLLSKAILPWFGGSSAVWTTCMLFFQLVLFSGYAYSHLLVARLPENRQWATHLVVLAVGAAWLMAGAFGDALAPVLPAASWKPSAGADPTWRVVLMLALTIGWPYFVLSTTGPLLQAWYGRLHPGGGSLSSVRIVECRIVVGIAGISLRGRATLGPGHPGPGLESPLRGFRHADGSRGLVEPAVSRRETTAGSGSSGLRPGRLQSRKPWRCGR